MAVFHFSHLNVPFSMVDQIKKANVQMRLDEKEFEEELENNQRIKKFFYSYNGMDKIYDIDALDHHIHID